MNRYGHLLKLLREQKGITQFDLSDGILSKNHLSKIERGENDISFQTLLKLLDRLNISLFEFELLLDKTQDNQSTFLKDLSIAVANNDLYLLNELLTREIELKSKSNNIRHKHNVILLKAYIDKFSSTPLNHHEIQEIIQYILTVDECGRYEISLFGNFVGFMSSDMRHKLVKMIYRKSQLFCSEKNYTEIFTRILLNVCYADIMEKKFNSAIEVIDIIEKYLNHTELYYEKNQCKFFKGLYLIGTQNKEEGEKLCKKCIEFFYFMNDISKAIEHQKVFNKFVNGF